MRQPDLYNAQALKKWPNEESVVTPSGTIFRPARPIAHNAFSFRWRWKLAWMVLTGKADVVRWDT